MTTRFCASYAFGALNLIWLIDSLSAPPAAGSVAVNAIDVTPEIASAYVNVFMSLAEAPLETKYSSGSEL